MLVNFGEIDYRKCFPTFLVRSTLSKLCRYLAALLDGKIGIKVKEINSFAVLEFAAAHLFWITVLYVGLSKNGWIWLFRFPIAIVYDSSWLTLYGSQAEAVNAVRRVVAQAQVLNIPNYFWKS